MPEDWHGCAEQPGPGSYQWAVEHEGHCIGSAGLRVDADQHCATYTVGLFVAGLRGRGLGREITRLVLSWAFGELGAHRVELQVLASNGRAVNCYLACGFRQEGTRREAELYPDGWSLLPAGAADDGWAGSPLGPVSAGSRPTRCCGPTRSALALWSGGRSVPQPGR
jgi:RimJ/RimL family protein N-acetyltransferase